MKDGATELRFETVHSVVYFDALIKLSTWSISYLSLNAQILKYLSVYHVYKV